MNHYLHVKADDAAEAIENYIIIYPCIILILMTVFHLNVPWQKSLALTGPLAVKL